MITDYDTNSPDRQETYSGERNAELAYKVLDHIDTHPEQWNQGVYIAKAECGTVGCFAGWAVLLSGAKPLFEFGSHRTDWVVVDGRELPVWEYAEQLLGAGRYLYNLGDEELDLFDAENTREHLGRLVEEIFGPRPDGATPRSTT